MVKVLNLKKYIFDLYIVKIGQEVLKIITNASYKKYQQNVGENAFWLI